MSKKKNVIINETIVNGARILMTLSTEKEVKDFNKSRLLKVQREVSSLKNKVFSAVKEVVAQSTQEIEDIDVLRELKGEAQKAAFDLIEKRARIQSEFKKAPTPKTLILINESGKTLWVTYKKTDEVGKMTDVIRSWDKGINKVRFFR